MKKRMRFRSIPASPKTLDAEARSVDISIATETPVFMYGEKEILLSSGVMFPRSGSIPLLNTHNRYDIDAVLGSVRNLRVEDSTVVGTAFFSKESDGAFTKVEEGHITDVSAGYYEKNVTLLKPGEETTIGKKKYLGPLRIVTRWELREASLAPIGVDPNSKIRSKGGEVMDQKLREFLETKGLDPDATDEEAWEFLQRMDIQKTKPTEPPKEPKKKADEGAQVPGEGEGDKDEMIRKAAAEEKQRCLEITAWCERTGMSERTQDYISRGLDVGEVTKDLLDQRVKAESPQMRFQMGQDASEKFREAAVDSILLRAIGMSEYLEEIKNPAPGAKDLRGYSLKEIARECLRLANKRTGGHILEMVGRAMTSSDFPYILADSARKSLFVGFDTAEETWETWCGVGEVSDFKQHSLVRASEADDLDEINEKQEYTYGDRTEAREVYQIATYGKLFAITRQAIINDDLNALTDIPASHGESAARKIGDLPYAVLVANAAMGDGVTLFQAAHGNVGTGGVVSVTTIGEAEKLMGIQTDLRGKRRLNIRPMYFLGPWAIKGVSEVFFRSERYAAEAVAGTPDEAFAATRANPYAGDVLTRVYDARLDAASTTAYYLAARKGKTITVYFLNGIRRPYLETKTGWSVDGVEYKVRIDAAAKAVHWVGMVYNAGV